MIETTIKWYEPDKGELPSPAPHLIPQGNVMFITKAGGMVSSGTFKKGLFAYHVDDEGQEIGLKPERIAFWAYNPLKEEAMKKYDVS